MSEYILRPEAGPVPYNKLQWRAQKALQSILEALNAAVNSASKAASDSGNGDSLSAIDRNRVSRLFFVSGEPGSGKSTLYVTLRAMLSKHEKDHKNYSEGYDKEPEPKVPIDSLRGVVRWLEPIDLEVVGDKEENLLAAVLVRLIRELADSSSGFSSPCDGAIKKLEELAADIGMAWESNLPARAGELDPDSYSMEVMRAQQARLGVNKRLREALDELAKNKCYGCTDSTLFVLPVDDLYLKPDASLQLLRLLRMISVPRLFFLIMGDITTVEEIFTEKALSDRTSVAGADVFQILPDRLEAVLARARELRARFLRKLLPPGQRIEIEPMDWYEAMKFSPELREAEVLGVWLAKAELDKPRTSASEDTSGEPQTKHQGNLFDFLTCRPLSYLSPLKGREEVKKIEKLTADPEKRKSREAYTGLQLLDATPREIMDLWSALQEFIKEQENKSNLRQAGNARQASSQTSRKVGSDYKIPLLSLVLEFVKLTIDEQNFLNEKDQSVVLNGVLPKRRYYDPDTYLKMDHLRLEPESGDWKAAYKVAEEEECRVWVRKHLPWELRVKPSDEKEEKARAVSFKVSVEGRESNATAEYQREGADKRSEARTSQTSGEFNMLPPRPTAWFVLLHDLAWMWRPASINKNLVENLKEELKDKEFKHAAFKAEGPEPSKAFPGWVALLDGSTYKSLPLPEFKTVRDLDCFLRVWNRGLEVLFPELENPEKPKKGEDEARLLVRLLWIFAGWTVIEKKYHYFAEQDKKWFDEGLRADSEQESPPSSPPEFEDKPEEWKEGLSRFRENAQIRKCLSQLGHIRKDPGSETKNEAGPTGPSSKNNFDDWSKDLLDDMCHNTGDNVTNKPLWESSPNLGSDSPSGSAPPHPSISSGSTREPDKGEH